MAEISRRDFFKRTIASGVAAGLVLSGGEKAAEASTGSEPAGTFIDMTLCDGCKDLDVPLCVSSCRAKNRERFPQPVQDIPNYWPQDKKEDWSDKKGLTTRLTPYNWTFVQKAKVEHNGRVQTVNMPRRCMHCTNPPCANICPFGAQEVTKEGAVLINPETCFGGAKCRDVCPWGIPARQAGVGLYMKILPDYLGGGVMYKCDLCIDLVRAGKDPACVEACPKGAVRFGPKSEMLAQAKGRAGEINGYVYGEKENGGTSTFYVSPVPFEKIDKALMAQKAKQPNPEAPGFPGMPVNPGNFLDTPNGIAAGILVAPIAGIFTAGYRAFKTMKGDDADDSQV
ncbi:MAG: oxidoreductase [Firmicutes bacterium HGW-Firmicutes-14]|nr:MAG: oxidoreductase [Firmicutes bacterium HGW-Firmicutes-14]